MPVVQGQLFGYIRTFVITWTGTWSVEPVHPMPCSSTLRVIVHTAVLAMVTSHPTPAAAVKVKWGKEKYDVGVDTDDVRSLGVMSVPHSPVYGHVSCLDIALILYV